MSSSINKKIIKFIRKISRKCGIELMRHIPSNSAPAQIAKLLKDNRINVIFDIGANTGKFAKEIREYGFSGKIVSFEPLSSAHSLLTKFALHDSEWHVHDQLAIGDKDSRIKINISGNSVSSSVLPMLKAHSSAAVESVYIDSEWVQLKKLDSVADEYINPSTNLFIKIDTQGFEWQVLDGASTTLNIAHGVLCELSLVPLYEGQKLWLDIIMRLEKEGFMLWALQQGFTDPKTGQTLQMDGVFLRKNFTKI
jgi:FkbM family methyltransferase